MRRIAIFVEGRTELNFVERLILEIAGKNNVHIERREITGGGRAAKKVVTLAGASGVSSGDDAKIYVLLTDCRGDSNVASYVRDEHEGLTAKGYEMIVGIRDVRPTFRREDIGRLAAGMRFGIKTSLCPVEFILSVMEIEACFVAEHSHFSRIDNRLTSEAVALALGYDPSTHDVCAVDTPSEDLHKSYRLVGRAYKKGGGVTVDVLDYENVYLNLAGRIPFLGRLIEIFDKFVQPVAAR